MDKIKVVDLFAGVGGFETGMKEAGFRFEGILECDKACCATLNANGISSKGSVSPTDIASIPPDSFSDVSVDYIVGGPPCQTFSAAGRRTGGVKGTEDPRGLLFSRYCLYVEWFRPKAFVLENVKGMLSSGQGRDFRLVCESFADIGYRLHGRYGRQKRRICLSGYCEADIPLRPYRILHRYGSPFLYSICGFCTTMLSRFHDSQGIYPCGISCKLRSKVRRLQSSLCQL